MVSHVFVLKGIDIAYFYDFPRLYITLGIHYKKFNKLATYKKKQIPFVLHIWASCLGMGMATTPKIKINPNLYSVPRIFVWKIKKDQSTRTKGQYCPKPLCLQTDNNNNIHHIIQLGSLWSYGSWIYNYLYNQCLSPLKLWVWTPFMARCNRYNFMW